jgi:hypothetical protein
LKPEEEAFSRECIRAHAEHRLQKCSDFFVKLIAENRVVQEREERGKGREHLLFRLVRE